jgi:ABC-type phosphate/phosphonate transport system ATPase subunit
MGRSVSAWLERLGLAARAADRLDTMSHGNQQNVRPPARSMALLSTGGEQNDRLSSVDR